MLLTLECRNEEYREQKLEEAIPSLVTGRILATGERKASEKSQSHLEPKGENKLVKEDLGIGEKTFEFGKGGQLLADIPSPHAHACVGHVKGLYLRHSCMQEADELLARSEWECTRGSR